MMPRRLFFPEVKPNTFWSASPEIHQRIEIANLTDFEFTVTVDTYNQGIVRITLNRPGTAEERKCKSK